MSERPSISTTTLAELRARGYRPGDENNFDLVDEALLAQGLELSSIVERYFRYQLFGVENIPDTGPGIIVSPHSLVSVDGFLLAGNIYRALGRLPRGLTDHDIFRIAGVRELFLRLGIVDGTPENAHRLLESHELLFIMPGGANEAWQPTRNKYRLYWQGHHGFVRVAIRAGAPVIPSVCIGAEEALYLPIHALEWGKRLLGKRVPVMFGLGALGIVPVPFPVKFTAYIGEPIHFDVDAGCADDPDVVRQCHTRVVESMSALIGRGLAARKSIWR